MHRPIFIERGILNVADAVTYREEVSQRADLGVDGCAAKLGTAKLRSIDPGEHRNDCASRLHILSFGGV